jgi:hypothetical protein
VYTLRKLLKEKAGLTFPADYNFTQAGGTQQRLESLAARCLCTDKLILTQPPWPAVSSVSCWDHI